RSRRARCGSTGWISRRPSGWAACGSPCTRAISRAGLSCPCTTPAIRRPWPMDATRDAGHGGHDVAVEPGRGSIRAGVRFGVALAVIAAIAMALVVGLFKLLDRGAEKKDAAVVAGVGLQNQPDRLPPAPRLQISGTIHWEEYRDAQRERLSTYGWMDRASGA